ncbi:sulfurtransferase TusA family protein [Methermicoccus shengliensis]|uniref:Sulfurtransferase TusA family protein n=1 Tax=Methermicoccus shengliensis TaxID=660064 RepID=A0A832RWT4_9EURY|nr:sulfurtransferase TusA family protein [Methermicoccus shengliensis]KUK04561.1 MAG: SirA family protein [Euryarchaeota archaeon 55_53]KUK29617.1 MAG: SirA family protein [Methanosarcinales archeaon 56_1174]MDI3487755.1 tRNA 2-thiouridine synthesizing protein [Methanosarcinales archaeon]MDN5294889.1 tRNA 2-thiouridine synthesizing protein [Methanosarcinales archaeon]HIH70080.1 sulfurtransferase TusA family protein [Methermicoccus shengliensis]
MSEGTQLLDLRGEVCPLTFVLTRLALEQMEKGEVLEVLIDHEPALVDLPRSVQMEDGEVLEISELSRGVWRLVLRR